MTIENIGVDTTVTGSLLAGLFHGLEHAGHSVGPPLEPEDLAALTMEASLMTKVPLAGTNYRPWENGVKQAHGKKCV